MNPVYDKLLRCYDSVKDRIPFAPDVALVLGSGLGDYADHIQVEAAIDYHEIEGFPVSTVPAQGPFCIQPHRGGPGGADAGAGPLL